MKQFIYRGVAYDADLKPQANRVYSRPEMFYRGVAHNGVRTLEPSRTSSHPIEMIYRGLRRTAPSLG